MNEMQESAVSEAELALASEKVARMRAEVGKVVIGQSDEIEQVLLAFLAGGHVLVEGVPGLGKTLLVLALARTFGGKFARVQFTPDLMPSDVTGHVMYDGTSSTFRLRKGPAFTNLLLADEINRASAKTQSALLEVMQEGQITIEGEASRLDPPFMTLATQNPIEQEGTYPLPEAQLDRFMFKLMVGYPTFEQETEVLARHHRGLDPHDLVAAGVRPVATAADLAAARIQVDQVVVEPAVLQYIVAICRATRESPSVELGVSPRGGAALLHASKAWAWLSGRGFVTPDEIKAVAKPTLRHRLLVRPELELEGVTPDGLLDNILATVPAPR